MSKSLTKLGKEFEKDFSDSFPISTWVYRIPDNATSFGTSTARFTGESRYDYLAWNGLTDKELYSFELKSTSSTSIPFADYTLSLSYERSVSDLENYRQLINKTKNNADKECIKILRDNLKRESKLLEKQCKAKSIKYHQIKNLLIDNTLGSKAYFIFNFRNTSTTYALGISVFYNFWKETEKKSINEKDIQSLSHVVIPQTQIGKSRHWKYDLSVLGININNENEYLENIVNSKTPLLELSCD